MFQTFTGAIFRSLFAELFLSPKFINVSATNEKYPPPLVTENLAIRVRPESLNARADTCPSAPQEADRCQMDESHHRVGQVFVILGQPLPLADRTSIPQRITSDSIDSTTSRTDT